MQPIFQLMKFARMKQVLRYFEWHAGATNVKISKILLGRFLLYALHADSDLDVEQIYRSLTSNPELQKSTMSVAEKLLAKGRSEGLEKGLEKGLERGLEKGLERGLEKGLEKGYWLGRIQSLEEFLEETKSPRETLELMTVAELEARHQQLHGEYQRRFK